MNYFELFRLPNQFKLDGSLLSVRFRELQKHFHPDNYATASERDRLLSVQKTAQINDAYQVLKKPITRAEYMLSEQGIDIKDEQSTMQDSQFLIQQMELREELESLVNELNVDEALLRFSNKVSIVYDSLLVTLEQHLEEKKWIDAAQIVRKLKFIEKLNQEIEQLEDKLFS